MGVLGRQTLKSKEHLWSPRSVKSRSPLLLLRLELAPPTQRTRDRHASRVAAVRGLALLLVHQLLTGLDDLR
ncbi:hypothetical protein CYMTET_22919 [Cymbomonas tetramitiformis]|uniref:Uncharacterized protein n=1 Tax=Cymbomonas tetramitiformis TaxID=36881 RepID=A0AAE0L1F4_9CHLO|nr:hypothetical protein CYMTET_22919 [Cymbomonas tetramitiformis]